MLELLRLRLTAAGSPPPLDQLLRAQVLLQTLARAGIDVDREPLGNYLAPILATSRESEDLLRDALAAIERDVDAPRDLPEDPVPEGLKRIHGRARFERRVKIGVGAVFLLLIFAAGIWIAREYLADYLQPSPEPEPNPLPPDPSLPDDYYYESPGEAALRVITRFIVPGMMTAFPFVALILWLARSRGAARAALRRMNARGQVLETLVVPPVATAILSGAAVRRALAQLRRPLLVRGARLDTVATIRETIRAGGAPDLRWRLEARAFEYVLLCESGGPSDHMVLLAQALGERLKAASVVFTRYDLDRGSEAARHADGRRSGPPVEPLAQVRRRHAGARLILLGSAESLLRRFDIQGGGDALGELIAAFESPLLLSTVPADRWGWREARLESLGVRIFTADEGGLQAAVASVSSPEADGRPPSAIPEGEDPIAASLQRDSLRYLSDVPPPASETALLVRRLRSFLSDVAGFPLLAATAAFPRIEPHVTSRMAVLVNGRPLDARLAARLSALPWMKAARMPDWLRLAILRQLPAAERERVRTALLLMLDDLRALSDREQPATANVSARLEILSREGVLEKVLRSVGIARRSNGGEGIFIRFLEGDDLGELEQEAPATRTPVTPARRLALAAIGGVGLLGTWAVLDLVPQVYELGWTRGTPMLILVAAAYTMVSWMLLRETMAPARKGFRTAGLALHAAAYPAMVLLGVSLSRETPVPSIVALLVSLALAGLHLHLLLDRPGPHLIPRPAGRAALRVPVFAMSIPLALGALPQDAGGGEVYVFVSLMAVPIGALLVLLAFTERPGTYAAIVRNFFHALAAAGLAGVLAAIGVMIGVLLLEPMGGLPAPTAWSGPFIVATMGWTIGYWVVGHFLDRRFARASLAFSLFAVALVVMAQIVPVESMTRALINCAALALAAVGSGYFVDERPLPPTLATAAGRFAAALRGRPGRISRAVVPGRSARKTKA
ncbi:MAG TPA: hypothetical protein VFQ67_13660 [Allosphingosinicella sp.]|nr:hypothetical protein [Allosphingosinicella sp.]